MIRRPRALAHLRRAARSCQPAAMWGAIVGLAGFYGIASWDAVTGGAVGLALCCAALSRE